MLAVAGCGGGKGTRTTTTTTAAEPAASKQPEPVQICAQAGRGWQKLPFTAHGARIEGAVLGDGDVGVVFANDSGNSACGWLSFARELAGRGMRAMVFDAAISLSAERSVGANLREILPLARRIRTPSLYVGSRDDGYTTFGRDTRQFHRVTPAKVNRMLLLPGGDHGVDLLSDENGPRVRKTILAFLQANAR